MAFEGRSLRAASQTLKDHLNDLLFHTITQKPLITAISEPSLNAFLSFRDHGHSSAAHLRTRFGPMDLFLRHVCDAVMATDNRNRLRTISYQYNLTPLGAAEPLLRWEYVRDPPDTAARLCRNHLQGPVTLDLGRGRTALLNDMHLPTGWVAIAEVLRFCIVDLGVRPLSTDWDERLRDSMQTSWSLFLTGDEL
jgi:hypothetical protein